MHQRIRFTRAGDGVRVAYATHGQGPPLVKVAHWMTHLEYDWLSPVWSHWLTELGRRYWVVRYDARDTGLSDRDVADVSLDAWVADLEAVVDDVGLGRFPLFAMSSAGPVAIAYAARHPERVSHLVCVGTYAVGRFPARVRPGSRRGGGAAHAHADRLGAGQSGGPADVGGPLRPGCGAGAAALVQRSAEVVGHRRRRGPAHGGALRPGRDRTRPPGGGPVVGAARPR